MRLPEFSSDHYQYLLPEEQIAQQPAASRGASDLLIATDKPFSSIPFAHLPQYIQESSVLLFNDTRVIPARLIFSKSTGAQIEIFLLRPSAEMSYEYAMAATGKCKWKVLVGNSARWKSGILSISSKTSLGVDLTLTAERNGIDEVVFNWDADVTFGQMLDILAHVPLPPYIKRSDNKEDKDRYQTVFARHQGSVAAPTAGLHFTKEILDELSLKKIRQVPLTLHVGLGTFRPVKGNIGQHTMHGELFSISHENLKLLVELSDYPWTCVGTTSLRALESLWMAGCALLNKGNDGQAAFKIDQWEKWNEKEPNGATRKSVFLALKNHSEKHGSNGLTGETSLLLIKGKPIRSADYLITNFHQPGSTLLMLVDAFSSVDWREAYTFALSNRMKFLSYGDACLFKNVHSKF